MRSLNRSSLPASSSVAHQLQALERITTEAQKKNTAISVPELLEALGDRFEGPHSAKGLDLSEIRGRVGALRAKILRRELTAGAVASSAVALGTAAGAGATGAGLLLVTLTLGALLFLPMWGAARMVGQSSPEHREAQALQQQLRQRRFLAQNGVDLGALQDPQNRDALQDALGYLFSLVDAMNTRPAPQLEKAAQASLLALGRLAQVILTLEATPPFKRRNLFDQTQRLRAIDLQLSHTKRPMLKESLRQERKAVALEVEALSAHLEAQDALKLERDALRTSIGTLSAQGHRLRAEGLRSGSARRLQADIDEAILSLEDLIAAQEEVQALASGELRHR